MLYPYTFPISGHTCEWRPLKVQEKIDVLAANKGSESALGSALLLRRIQSWNGKPDSPTPKEWGELDELDANEFDIEVSEKEAARLAALRKKRTGGNHLEMLKSAVADVQSACGALSKAVENVLIAAEAADIQNIPLT